MSSATFSIPKSNMPLLLRFDLISCRRNTGGVYNTTLMPGQLFLGQLADWAVENRSCFLTFAILKGMN
jgi:hypothetical protein